MTPSLMTPSLMTPSLMTTSPEAAAPPDHRPDPARPADRVLEFGRGAPLPRADAVPVHELTARFARLKPAATAVSCGDSAISYRELDAWAARIAARLTTAGVHRGSRVGILAQPSTAMVAAVLGVLKAGAAYVPVDPGHPDRHVATVLNDAHATALVATTATAGRAGALHLPVVRAEEEERPDARDGDGDEEADHAHPSPAVADDDPAYLIYTSGSTGAPKGVEVGHRQLAASTRARHTVYPAAPVFLLVSPLAFDSSVAGLWDTLTTGGHLVVATADEVRDPERLVTLVGRHHVTRLLCVPSLYAVLLDAAERLGTERLRTLDTVITAGEALPAALLHRHFAVRTAPASLVNEYGPTEATVWASYRRYDTPGPVSIGGPVPGARLYVLDEQQRPVPPGVEGELFIGGAGVSHGYAGRPRATERSFPDDPFAGTPGARMYRTGDLARWNDDGTLDFLGRRDHQVKIRGHRIELSAVEAALGALPGVREAVVVHDEAGTRLTGFVTAPAPATAQVTASATAPGPEELRAQLRELLPAAMVPARITVLDELPRTVNGKADRAALRARAVQPHQPPATAAARPAPGSGPHPAVTAAWAEVLGLTDVPPDVNFFDLGGHSLAMFQLQSALERHTGKRPAIVQLFRHTTVAAQAELIHSGGAEAHDTDADTRRETARRARALRARRHRAEQEPGA
ncbi:non-ribosomal peptide synthetase [Streptomyces sp. LHD-70]|uniref:non-ribosomal peptide synthetase n=1 Tax=Streptomyces sp. LHD-70 TaxID=3072140 RepID=UPI00280ED971|nr:non-ribosomal peptide synthetase [Streptomyces sp. LHD-70]MDQ8706957.1 non-ribosomal peptide synthetase [Streptomyces sp. LHD-70]